jgi:hypothetical protein
MYEKFHVGPGRYEKFYARPGRIIQGNGTSVMLDASC